jgi:hypothetical protein
MENQQQDRQEQPTADSKKSNKSNNFTLLAYVIGVFLTLGVGLLVILMRSKAY